VFDEAETLTDQAQIALRPLLDKSPNEVLIIFLCNSVSRIHASIIHKFLLIPFEAPNHQDFKDRMEMILKTNTAESISGLDVEFRRGDIRFFILNPGKYQDCAKLWVELFMVHRTKIPELFEQILQKWTFPDLAMFCLFCSNATNVLTKQGLTDMLQITDTDFIKSISGKQRSYLLANWFETSVRQKLETWPPPKPVDPPVEAVRHV
jgi:DNA polymerase III delta prime subunit